MMYIEIYLFWKPSRPSYFNVFPCLQWAVVGDTFPVGCAIVPSIVFGAQSFKENPDTKNNIYKFVNILIG